MSNPKWKTVRVRADDYALISALKEVFIAQGLDGLSDAARRELAAGVTAGSVVAAALAALRTTVIERPKPDKRAKR